MEYYLHAVMEYHYISSYNYISMIYIYTVWETCLQFKIKKNHIKPRRYLMYNTILYRLRVSFYLRHTQTQHSVSDLKSTLKNERAYTQIHR